MRRSDYPFVVVIHKANLVELNYVGHKSNYTPEKWTVLHHVKRYQIPAGAKDVIIKMLVDLGFRVRFFESQEKAWMEQSEERGVETVQGNRDGSWGLPTIDEYKSQYIGIRSIIEQEEGSQR